MSRKTCAELIELLFNVKAEARLWASQLRINARGEVQILLAAVDALKRDIALAENTSRDLRLQVRGLQDSRRETLARMLQMAPRAEVELAKAESASLRAVIERMQQEAAALEQERDRLQSSLQASGRFFPGVLAA